MGWTRSPICRTVWTAGQTPTKESCRDGLQLSNLVRTLNLAGARPLPALRLRALPGFAELRRVDGRPRPRLSTRTAFPHHASECCMTAIATENAARRPTLQQEAGHHPTSNLGTEPGRFPGLPALGSGRRPQPWLLVFVVPGARRWRRLGLGRRRELAALLRVIRTLLGIGHGDTSH
jgi:hypothetical protein